MNKQKHTIMKTLEKINQSKPIFWKGKQCKFINWESLNFEGKIKIKISSKFIVINLDELSN